MAELSAVHAFTDLRLLAADFLVGETESEPDMANLIKRLGGIVKAGRILSASALDKGDLEIKVQQIAEEKQAAAKEGKFNFGFSDYGRSSFNKQDLGLKLKKYLSAQGVSSRFVVSREKTLSSVVVAQNKLLTRGIEIVLSVDGGNTLIGETLAVQPFKDLSLRDYGRPARDDLSGMLPPKLAQAMINLAQIDSNEAVIIDPFCGSGTILSEAALLGYKHLFGSDISAKAIDDTHKNISWLKELYKIEGLRLKLAVKKAENLSKFIKADSADAIITEPFLGPQRGQINFSTVISNLEAMYSESIREFHKVLKRGGRVVMVWPNFYGQKPMSPSYSGFKMINMIPDSLRSSEFIKKTGRDTIIYGRPGQKVYREIVVLEKI
ncbi:MAG: methyltransferase domain-containing protein [Candidatus Pacearchaeota archaeon]